MYSSLGDKSKTPSKKKKRKGKKERKKRPEVADVGSSVHSYSCELRRKN